MLSGLRAKTALSRKGNAKATRLNLGKGRCDDFECFELRGETQRFFAKRTSVFVPKRPHNAFAGNRNC